MTDNARAIALIEEALSLLKVVEPLAAPAPLDLAKPKVAGVARQHTRRLQWRSEYH